MKTAEAERRRPEQAPGGRRWFERVATDCLVVMEGLKLQVPLECSRAELSGPTICTAQERLLTMRSLSRSVDTSNSFAARQGEGLLTQKISEECCRAGWRMLAASWRMVLANIGCELGELEIEDSMRKDVVPLRPCFETSIESRRKCV